MYKKIFLLCCLVAILGFNFSCRKEKKLLDRVSIRKKDLKRIKKSENFTNLFTLQNKYILYLEFGLGNIISLKINNKYIGLLARGNYTSVYIFNKQNGKFIGKAGDRGKGPGDFLSISDFLFLSKNKILTYDIVLNRFNIYKIESKKIKHLKSFLLMDESMSGLSQMTFVNNRIYTFNNSNYKGNYKNFILDKNFKIINKYDKFKHTSYVAWEPSVLKNDRIYIANEVWHTSSKALSKDPFKNAKCEKSIDVYDLNGNFLREINSHIEKNYYKTPIYFNKEGSLMLIDKKIIVDINGKLIKKLKEKKSFKENEKFYREVEVSYNLDGILKTFIPDRLTKNDNTVVIKTYEFLKDKQ